MPIAQPTSPSFDLFALIGRNDEYVHKRVLTGLMKPDGAHSLGTSVLKAVLGSAGLPCAEGDLSGAHVVSELWGLDIAVELPEQDAFVGFELKFDAPEGPEQLARQQKAIASERGRGTIVFLTKDGRKPETASKNSPVEVVPITWKAVEEALRKIPADGDVAILLEALTKSLADKVGREKPAGEPVSATHVGVTEASRRLGRNKKTIRRWYHQGILPGRRLGDRIEFEEELIKAIEQGESLPLDEGADS